MDWQDKLRRKLALLARDGSVWCQDKLHSLATQDQNEEFDCIKQMYSDHFLVGSKLTESQDGTTVIVRLVDTSSLLVHSTLKFSLPGQASTQKSKCVRLLRPRYQVELAFIQQSESLCLVGSSNRKLYHILSSDLFPNTPLSYLRDGQWIAAGKESISTFKVLFPVLLAN